MSRKRHHQIVAAICSTVDAASKAISRGLGSRSWNRLSSFQISSCAHVQSCKLLSSIVLGCEICLDGSADGILRASFKGNTNGRPAPYLGKQVGRGADGIRPPFLSPTAKIPVTKGQRECNQTLLVYSAAVSFGSCPVSKPAWAFSFSPSTCQYVSYPAALLGVARHNSFIFFN